MQIDQMKNGLEPGQYTFPFEFEVPQWFPPSMIYTQTIKNLIYLGSDQIAGIKYQITATFGKYSTTQCLIIN